MNAPYLSSKIEILCNELVIYAQAIEETRCHDDHTELRHSIEDVVRQLRAEIRNATDRDWRAADITCKLLVIAGQSPTPRYSGFSTAMRALFGGLAY